MRILWVLSALIATLVTLKGLQFFIVTPHLSPTTTGAVATIARAGAGVETAGAAAAGSRVEGGGGRGEGVAVGAGLEGGAGSATAGGVGSEASGAGAAGPMFSDTQAAESYFKRLRPYMCGLGFPVDPQVRSSSASSSASATPLYASRSHLASWPFANEIRLLVLRRTTTHPLDAV